MAKYSNSMYVWTCAMCLNGRLSTPLPHSPVAFVSFGIATEKKKICLLTGSIDLKTDLQVAFKVCDIQ